MTGPALGERAAVCPACARAVDPLRAGEVAILDGAFWYFCGRDCKRTFLTQDAAGSMQDAVTAAPPEVANADVTSRRRTPQWPDFADLDEAAALAPNSEPPREDELERPLRRPRMAPRTARLREAVSWLALAFGLLSWAVALLGPSAAGLRYPLAGLAALVFAFRMVSRDDCRPLSEAILLALPPALLLLFASTSLGRGRNAGLLSSALGLGCAAALLQQMLIEHLEALGFERRYEDRPNEAGAPRARGELAAPAGRLACSAPSMVRARLMAMVALPAAGAFVAGAGYAAGSTATEALVGGVLSALGLSLPGALAAMGAHHAKAEALALDVGVHVVDPAMYERAGRAEVAVLCSRGTVLAGEPEVVGVVSTGDFGEERLLTLAASAEATSEHPVARALQAAAKRANLTLVPVKNLTEAHGLGVTGLVGTDRIVVGGRGLLLAERVSVATAEERLAELEAAGRSALLVALADRLIGFVTLEDALKAGARAAVQRLLDARVEPVLLTGESAETCRAIARSLDVEHIRPEVVPQDRGAEVLALGEGGQVVAVIGQAGTDDAALRAAALPLALGSIASAPPGGGWGILFETHDARAAAAFLAVARTAHGRARNAMVLAIGPGVVASLAVAFGLAPLQVAALAAPAGAIASFLHARR